MNRNKKILTIAAVIILIFFVFLFFKNKKSENEFSINKNLNSLNLITHEGKILKANKVISSTSIFFFGFLNCPDICPLTLTEISQIIIKLGSDSKKINFFFVTVDPERDKVIEMNKYLNNFHKDIIGITGSLENMRKFLNSMHVYYKKIYIDKDFYTLDHSSQLFIFKKRGEFFGTISLDESENTIFKKIKSLI